MPWLFPSLSSIIAVGQRLVKWPRGPPAPDSKAVLVNDSEKEGPRATSTLHTVVQELQRLIEQDADLYMGFHQMFEQIPDDPKYDFDPLGNPQVRNYEDMLEMFDTLLTYAPEFGEGALGDLVPVPLNAKLNWPMCTSAGFRVFTNPKFNAQLKKILNVWGDFLSSPESCHVLTNEPNGWFGPEARKTLPNFEKTYECDPSKEYHGFTSWDDFFTKRFRPGVRPVSHPEDDTIIVSACESVVYKISHNAQAMSPFWLKGQPYSLNHMLNYDPLSSQFVGGTVYQAYLSVFNYHRWHSPVSGTITKIIQVPGTYYAVSPACGFENGGDPGSYVPEVSQAFTTHLATRILIFIQADHTSIGLMCFIGVGMVEVSSCEATVVVGQRVEKGDELGMFHYGGSTHCLVFRPETEIVFGVNVLQSLRDGTTKVLLNSYVGYISTKSG